MNSSPPSNYDGVSPMPTRACPWAPVEVYSCSNSSESDSPSNVYSSRTPEAFFNSSPPPTITVSTRSLLPSVDRWLPVFEKTDDRTLRPHFKVASVHPYARIYSKKQAEAAKRRKVWTHAFEKTIFTPHEISTMSAPNRRSIYQASLEAYIDDIHEKLLAKKLFPVPLQELKPWDGLNNKTARSLLSGLQYDSSLIRSKLKELERTNLALRNIIRS